MKPVQIITNIHVLRVIIQNIERKILLINVFVNLGILMMEAMNFVLEVVITVGNFFIY